MQIGEYKISAVETGEFRLDGGAMFGVVPKVLWEKKNPADEKNRIRMALRGCLIEGHQRKILVDTGIGEKWGDKQREMYAIDHSRSTLGQALSKLQVRKEEITDVIVTHLHFDHVGGTTELVNGKAELTFPNATYFVQKRNLDHAHAPTEKDRASFVEDTIGPLLSSSRVKVIDGNVEIAPGVRTWTTQGHTPGHQMVWVEGGGKGPSLLCPGDTIPTASHIPIPWVMSYDLEPLVTMDEKRQIYKKAIPGKWVLFFVHDPFRAAATVIEEDGKFRMKEEVKV